jgi:hypothetical protein
MVFKKVFQSGNPVILSHVNDNIKFPPGFSYRIGGTIYTVKEDITEDKSSPMREVSLSDGSTEIMTVSSIARDLKEVDCQVLEMDKRFVKKVIDKKTVKKVTKKKKKNGK